MKMKFLALIFLASAVNAYHKYMDMPSDEIDSEEHGVYPGEKATSCKCGWANRVNSRVVGGQETGINQFPWMTGISDGSSIICGGTIISEYHVLTAAHCTDNRTADSIYVLVGAHTFYSEDDTDSRKLIDVKSIKQHQNYDHFAHSNDISLLEVNEKIIFSNKVGPACLPTSREFDIIDKYIKVIGWGTTTFNGTISEKLLQANLRVIPLEICKQAIADITMYDDFVNTDVPTQICTYSKSKDACQGDSGGPVVFLDPETNMYTLVGVVSYGIKCATETPGVQTDVTAFLDWIQDNIQSTNPAAITCAKI